MTKYLGIDYGLSHIGLSVSEHMLAQPLPSLLNDRNLYQNLSSVIVKEKINLIVCGIPEGPLVPVIQDFAQQLTDRFHLQVVLHPETLSSQDAQAKLKEINSSRTKRKNDHSYAACLILEDYLELNPVLY